MQLYMWKCKHEYSLVHKKEKNKANFSWWEKTESKWQIWVIQELH